MNDQLRQDALAYHAATGTFKPSEEPHDHREFYGPTILVTPDDAAAFIIILLVLCINFIGDALRDAVDPRNLR